MLLTRLRVWLKNFLTRDSLPYRMARFVYQTWLQLETRLFRGKRASRQITDNSIFVLEEEMSMCSIFPKEILDLTIELFQPRSVLDVGCGTGISLDYFKSKGIAVRGLEGSALAISKARNASSIRQHDLNEAARPGGKVRPRLVFRSGRAHSSALYPSVARHPDESWKSDCAFGRASRTGRARAI